MDVPPVLPHLIDEGPAWYAAYTRSRHEKRIAEQLQSKSVEIFLPLYETVHQWKNGRARVQLPLFPGYIFVRIPYRDRLRVLEAPGVAYLVGSAAHATPVADSEMDLLRRAMDTSLGAEPYPYLSVGQRVRIKFGPLAGAEGILIRKKQNLRLVLSIDLIMRSIMVDVDGCDVEGIGSPMRATSFCQLSTN
jgi:transcription antitermination factor NusG